MATRYVDSTGDILSPLKVYDQTVEPTLDDGKASIWVDDSDQVWLLYKHAGVAQKKVQLT